MVLWIIAGVVACTAAAGGVFLSRPEFGRLPRGERLERIRCSPNYRDGAFRNELPTPVMTSESGRLGAMRRLLFHKSAQVRPTAPLPVMKTDLRALPRDRNLLVWFGHSSYLIQSDGMRVLVDPVFCTAAPAAFLNKPFPGTDVYRPEDMPYVDCLVITHDHWDHLDYRTVVRLRERVRSVVCPLGVGEHFERWGFAKERITELDWYETGSTDSLLTFHCLPARHFSGRGLLSGRTLWASFMLESPSMKIFIAGDGGYGPHFARIGTMFPEIDLAILENGQYNADWRCIHMMPGRMALAAAELGAKRILTVHHSKYALARHPWYEPFENVRRMIRDDSLDVLAPRIGEVVELGSRERHPHF